MYFASCATTVGFFKDRLLVVILHGLLALSLLSGNGFVGLVSLSELLAHFFSRCVVVFLEPWVGHDIRDGKTLMRMEVQHCGDKVLELFGEEALWLSVGVGRPELL